MSPGTVAPADPVKKPSPFVVDAGSYKSHRNDEAKETPTRTLYLYMNLMSLSDIDTVTETFAAYFFIRATWVEPDLAAADAADGAAIPEACWTPRLMFMNLVSTPEFEDEKLEVSPWRKSHDGRAVLSWSTMVRGSFREKFELQTFPFDVQPLSITISTKNTHVVIVEDTFDGVQSKIREEFLVLPDFTVDNRLLFISKPDALGKFALMDVRCLVRRRWSYQFWNIYIPICLLTTMTFASFLIPVGDVADRLSVTLTLVLASVAFKYVVAQELPRISYLTSCDIYVFANFVFIFLVVGENCLAGWLAAKNEELGQQFEEYATVSFVVAYGLLTLVYALWISMAARAAKSRPQVASFSAKKA